jgi:hypothetical protein
VVVDWSSKQLSEERFGEAVCRKQALFTTDGRYQRYRSSIIPRQERFAMSDIEVLEGKMKMPTR